MDSEKNFNREFDRFQIKILERVSHVIERYLQAALKTLGNRV